MGARPLFRQLEPGLSQIQPERLIAIILQGARFAQAVFSIRSILFIGTHVHTRSPLLRNGTQTVKIGNLVAAKTPVPFPRCAS